MIIEGITLSSRYGIEAELNKMKRLVFYLDKHAPLFKSIFCDSKMGSSYFFQLKRKQDPELIETLKSLIDRILISIGEGHNGFVIGTKMSGSPLGFMPANWELLP
jgi:hypothetical protein